MAEDGRTWWKAKILPCKHAIAAYGATIVRLPSQIAYMRVGKKIHLAIPPWPPFSTAHY